MVEEVEDIYVIFYDRKINPIVKRTTKKRRITLYCSILIIIEENLINIVDARKLELLSVGMELSDATLDRDKRDEKELATALKELEHLRHLVEYYQGATHTTVYLRSEFEEAYKQFTK
jgi:hypothetical protein